MYQTLANAPGTHLLAVPIGLKKGITRQVKY